MVPSYAQAYQTRWEQFTKLGYTQDSLALERRGLRRWLRLSHIAFVIPIDNPVAVAQLEAWQAAFRSVLPYDPPSPHRFHITLHYAGLERQSPWQRLPHIWRHDALPGLAERVRVVLEAFPQFEVALGPLNAFPNVLFAEVQDDSACLRALRATLRRALPLRARPPLRWAFLPHVTLGYWGEQPVEPLVAALQSHRTIEPVPCPVNCVRLTVYRRDPGPPDDDVLQDAHEDVIAEFRLRAETP